jgi:hypothetical protein
MANPALAPDSGWPFRFNLQLILQLIRVKMLDDPASLSGDPVLLGFVLPVSELWEPPE